MTKTLLFFIFLVVVILSLKSLITKIAGSPVGKSPQTKQNSIQELHKDTVLINDTSKNKDTIFVKKLSQVHKVQVLGYYSDVSKNNIKSLNYKLLTSLIYGVNIDYTEKNKLGNNIYAIDSARKAGCKIILSLYNNSPQSTSKILNSNSARTGIIQRAIKLMNQINGNGINVDFNGFDAYQKSYFVSFIASLREALPKNYSLSVTLPAGDKDVAYNLKALNRYINNFIIDFRGNINTPGPLAPLNNHADYSVETCFSRYICMGISPSKFIMGLSYSGIMWLNKPQKLFRYIPYNTIHANYSGAKLTYPKGQSSAQINAMYKHSPINIWYDDEKTLGEKYDYLLANGLGGVQVKTLGDDNGYGELQKVLSDKFIKIDTTVIDNNVISPPPGAKYRR